MSNILSRYFLYPNGPEELLNPPADPQQIAQVEEALGIVFPQDYKDFLLTTNGLEAEVGETVTIFEPVENIVRGTTDCCAESFPWAVFIGSNGNLEMFVIDKRSSPHQFGLLPYIADEADFIPLGASFEQFLSRIKDGTAFEKNDDTF